MISLPFQWGLKKVGKFLNLVLTGSFQNSNFLTGRTDWIMVIFTKVGKQEEEQILDESLHTEYWKNEVIFLFSLLHTQDMNW